MKSIKKIPFIQIFLVQVREYIRDPGVLFWALGFPITMAYVLGLAFSAGRPTEYRVAIVSDDVQQKSIVEKKLSNIDRKRFHIIYSGSGEEVTRLMQKGHIAFFITMDNDVLRYHFDPANEQSLMAYFTFKENLRGNSQEDLVVLKGRGQRYIDFLVPGLLAMGIMNSAIWGSGWVLIEYRMKKLLRRMAATPMRKWEFFLGHAMTRLTLNVFEFSFLWVFAYMVFDIPFNGSTAGLALVFLSGNFAFNGIAVLTASRTDNSRIGNGLINAVTMPMMLLSGVFFSYENFPQWAVNVIRYLPLTLIVDSLRTLFLEGAVFSQILYPSVILIFIGSVTFILGLRFFRWS